jgi:hypothetical protein
MLNRRSFVFAATAFLAASSAIAAEAPKPAGDVVLTVKGAIENRNPAGVYEFDMAMIKALPAVEIDTSSPWTEGVAHFKGVALKDILATVGSKGVVLSAAAINDYAVEIPVVDADVNGAFVAYEMNGAEMSVREKGPLWVLYPFDSKPELKAEEFYARSIWQLKSIEVKP